MAARFIMRNRCAGPDIPDGESEYLTIDADGETVERLNLAPARAVEIAAARGLEIIPPARLLSLWREARERKGEAPA